MPVNSVAAVIIAAGSSSRLGKPKQLLILDGETLLERAIRITHEAGAAPVLVVLGAHRDEIQARLDFADSKIVINQAWEEGMASSIRAGLEALLVEKSGSPCVLLITCDQPCVTPEHLGRMIDAFRHSETSAIASVYAGKRGIPAIYPRSAFPELLALHGDIGARSLLSEPDRDVIEISLDGGEVDIDRPEDLSQLRGS
jgi:molybdenum cofactor cytidylyltransferase